MARLRALAANLPAGAEVHLADVLRAFQPAWQGALLAPLLLELTPPLQPASFSVLERSAVQGSTFSTCVHGHDQVSARLAAEGVFQFF